MKEKGKILIVGLIALLMMGTLVVLTGCGEKCSQGMDCVVKTDDESILKQLFCNNSDCAVTKLRGTPAYAYMNVTCDCKW
jgi:hypothetical protein